MEDFDNAAQRQADELVELSNDTQVKVAAQAPLTSKCSSSTAALTAIVLAMQCALERQETAYQIMRRLSRLR